MENVLIVSYTENSIKFFNEMLKTFSASQIVTLRSCSEARRILLEQEFDLVIINAPLCDESGESLAKHIASKGICQVILIVKAEFYEEVALKTENYGVMTIAKPINKNIFWTALKLAKSAQNRMQALQKENSKLSQKIEDIKIVDRAKCILISYLKMDEQEAHRYIEKQAMDMRMTKRAVAEGILKTYEN